MRWFAVTSPASSDAVRSRWGDRPTRRRAGRTGTSPCGNDAKKEIDVSLSYVYADSGCVATRWLCVL